MMMCTITPCGQTSGGCFVAGCPRNPYRTIPAGGQAAPMPAPTGCVCPPTAEKTCEGINCPRRNPFKNIQAMMGG